jgi:hypothetical protein
VLLVALLVVLSLLAGCSGSGGGSGSSPDTQDAGGENTLSLDLATLFSTVSAITVHVAYEPDAQPFTGTMQNGVPYWSIFESNIDALFLDRTIQPDVEVPMTLGEMTEIPEQGHASWTPEEILDLAGQVYQVPQTSTTADFFVLFLNGLYNDQAQVIGLSIGGSPVIAVFKDVLLDSDLTMFIQIFIEQATLVHEFGHGVGLVNNGIPMASDHEDPDHPHHCSNSECVMFWENDNVSIVNFIEKIRYSSSSVIFGQECLDDARSFRP